MMSCQNMLRMRCKKNSRSFWKIAVISGFLLLAVISKVLRLPALQSSIHATEVLYTCHAPSGWALPGFERNHDVRSFERNTPPWYFAIRHLGCTS